MSLSGNRALSYLVLAAGLVGLPACADRTLAPDQAGPSFDFRGGNGGHRFHERDCRGDGQAGQAAVTVTAVYGADGYTEITLTSYDARDTLFATPAGCITSVDLSAYARSSGDRWQGDRYDGDRGHHRDHWFSGDDHGAKRWTRHYDRLKVGNTFTVRVSGLQPGMRLDVDATVGCIVGRRTDDVEAQVTIVRRTDPALAALAAPAQAPVNLPVLLTAKIRELNGQQGATGTCYLTVGSTVTDSLPGVAVAAGDSTTCSFAPTFATAGFRQVTVSYGHVTPRDDNPGNNSASASVQIVAATPGGGGSTPPTGTLQPFVVSASAYDDTALVFADVFAMSERLASDPAVLRDTTNFTTATTGNVQFAGFEGTIYEAVPFPLTALTVSQATGTTTYHSQSWTNLAANNTSAANSQCADVSSGVITLLVCAYDPDATFPSGRTTISYVRADSNVSQVQSAYYVDYSGPTPSACDPTSTDPNQPCYTINTALGPALPHYQSAYTFNVVLETATRRYAALVSIPLASGLLDQSSPYVCDVTTVTGGDNIAILQSTCQGTQLTRQHKAGQVSDLIAVTQAK